LALKALPLYLAEFPGEYHGASAEKRRQAFERLLDLPNHAMLRPIRAAAARRSMSELRRLAADSLLVEAQAASLGPNAPSHFGSTVVFSGEDVGYGPASLALLRGFTLVLPEHTSPDEVCPVSAAPQRVEAPQTVPAQFHDRNNPYPGLRPFEPEEARLFFGRGVHTSELLRRLSRTRFLAVVGTSGSGKSSLVRAGLIPALREGAFGQTASHWRIVILRPGGDPIGALALALVSPDVLGGSAGTTAIDKDLEATLAEVTLRRSAFGLADTVRQARLASGEHVLVVVDQFEELFRFKREAGGRRGSEDAAAFVKLLLEASRAPDVPVYVVLTMRSDYLGDCAEFQDLPETINDAQYLIPRLTREQRRETIEAPARVAGGAITPRLVQRLLNDVGDSPDQLPIMQHALMRTWDRWAAAGAREAPLDTPHYEAIGRMESALSQHADELYHALSSDRLREITEWMFKALTDKTEDGRGVRRATRLDQLAAAAEAQPEEVEAVIETFRQPGCSFLMPPVGTPLRADTIVDISHESLMRIWTRLRDWVDKETESAQTYRRLAETAELYLKHRAGLWGDPDLTQALDWREREQPNEAWARRYNPDFTAAMGFLDVSDQAARQTQRRTRSLRLGALGISGTVAVVMFLLWARAEENLKQVQAFVDANRLDQLTRRCPLLFAPETLSPEELNHTLAEPCGKVLQAVRDLALHRRDYDKTLDTLRLALQRRDYDKTLNILRKEEMRDEFQYGTVLRLVVELNTLANARFLEPGANEDEALTKLVEKLRSAHDPAKWQVAVIAILENPRYKGFTLKPQVDLIPLGEDPDSRLYEFVHVRSGAVPERGPDGRLMITADTGIILILIPGGTFLMGSKEGASNEKPQHEVTVRPFFIAKHELTREQLARLTGKHSADDGLRPADSMSFYDARQVAAALGLRLPTEAEWEYAARAGTTSRYWWGEVVDQGGEVWANCDECGSKGGFSQLASSGSFPPNSFGLYDTAGNVSEWVEDCYHDTYTGAPTDGSAWVSGDCKGRVRRGGSIGTNVHSAKRDPNLPSNRSHVYGFRLARTLP
jgi:hypothetical protein